MSDDLAPARGCIYGTLLGAALITGIAGGAAIFIALWQVMP